MPKGTVIKSYMAKIHYYTRVDIMDYDASLLNAQSCDTNTVYKQYKNIISDIIAYIEVYEHDLPGDMMAVIAELFQMLAFYETESQDIQENDKSEALYDTLIEAQQSLCLHAICLLIKKIEEYKKVFRKYKYKGIMEGSENFAKIVKREEKRLSKIFKNRLNFLYKGKLKTGLKGLSIKEKAKFLFGYLLIQLRPSFKTFKKEPYIPKTVFINDFKQESLMGIYVDIKILMEEYQKVLPAVISNGTNKPLFISIFIAVTGWFIPIALLIPTIIKLFGGE